MIGFPFRNGRPYRFRPSFSFVSVTLMSITGACFGSGLFGLGALFYTLACLSVGANLSSNRYPVAFLEDDPDHTSL